MDITCTVGTDIASFYLYEPDLLTHRGTSPWCWFSDFAETSYDRGDRTVPERMDGRLAVIGSERPEYIDGYGLTWYGSDGAYRLRCTTAGLTADEAAREYPETKARPDTHSIRVTQGRLLLDGGYLIPYDHTLENDRVITEEEALAKDLIAWLPLPSGRYTMVAHYLAPSDGDHSGPEETTIVLTFARTA
jgi:hypothetical protein